MALIFNQRVLHGRTEFLPGVPVAFEDKDAEPYFTALGWAEVSKKEAVRTYSQEEVSIDAETVVAETGRKVLEG